MDFRLGLYIEKYIEQKKRNILFYMTLNDNNTVLLGYKPN